MVIYFFSSQLFYLSARMKKQVLEVSEAAARRILELLAHRHKDFLRLSVVSRGCSAFSYTMTYADKPAKLDELVEGPRGVKVLVDNKALMHVVGTRMDFVSDNLRSEFVFDNPNTKGACGCGESFVT